DIMELNIIDIVILVCIGISLISGMYRGFLASGLTTVGFFGAFFGAQSFYPRLATAIRSNSSLMNVFTYYLDAESLFSTVGLSNAPVETAAQTGTLSRAVSELSGLPNSIITALQSNISRQTFESMGYTTIGDYLNQTILIAVVNVVSFIVLFIVAYIVLQLIVNLLNNVFHFPLLKHFDWALGGIFGLVRGYVIVALILAVIPMAMSIIDLTIVDELISQSALAGFFPDDFVIGSIILRLT
ncbi:MAG: CvpA family protein, partial [Clostridia bacterium]|nr:CvpA family protein [Clostridia bacterium]